jgi:endonuclease/exonuclease/phosphatase family metal-dependent hydrolase
MGTKRILVVALALGCAWSAPVRSAGGADAADRAGTRIRVMAWNIRHGEGEDGKLDLERIARVILKSDPDIVLLQEVDDRATRTGGVAQVAELGRLTGLDPTFGKAMDFQGGGYGNAVLTRWKPAASRVVPLPGGGEPRCALVVSVDVPGGGRVSVASTHLDVSVAAARDEHAKHLAAELARGPELVLLGGDFNATSSDPPLAAFTPPWLIPTKHGENTGTIPARQPNREIDFILIKPAHGAPPPVVGRYVVIEENTASDHRPIVMELRWPEDPGGSGPRPDGK